MGKASGQTVKSNSVVYLHDGSVYIGEIIKEDIFEIILKTASVDTIRISKSYVKKTIKAKNIMQLADGKYHKISGNFMTYELALGVGPDSHYSYLSLAFGKRIWPKLQVGLGASLASASGNIAGDFWEDHSFVQVFGVGKYFLTNKKARLFTEMRAGWGFSLVDDWAGNMEQGGLYVSPAIGFEFANRKKMKWSVKLSQNLQHVKAQTIIGNPFENPSMLSYKHWYNRTALSVGINF